jgi:hypothetical protein
LDPRKKKSQPCVNLQGLILPPSPERELKAKKSSQNTLLLLPPWWDLAKFIFFSKMLKFSQKNLKKK